MDRVGRRLRVGSLVYFRTPKPKHRKFVREMKEKLGKGPYTVTQSTETGLITISGDGLFWSTSFFRKSRKKPMAAAPVRSGPHQQL